MAGDVMTALLGAMFIGIVALGVWASRAETREQAKISQGLAEWDAETRRLRRLYEQRIDNPHIR
jgi:hypothetical protein